MSRRPGWPTRKQMGDLFKEMREKTEALLTPAQGEAQDAGATQGRKEDPQGK